MSTNNDVVDIHLPNQRTSTKYNSYLAVSICEGFCEGEDATQEEQLEAWAYLIMTGLCWSLQGWFGRNARSLIDNGIISKDGTINWDEIYE